MPNTPVGVVLDVEVEVEVEVELELDVAVDAEVDVDVDVDGVAVLAAVVAVAALDVVPAAALLQAGVSAGAGLALDTQVLPFQLHHRQALLSW
jgi:hypothetical protein